MRMIFIVLAVAAAPGQQSVSDAVMNGDAKAVAAVIARGGDVNEKDSDGITPLMQAASAGHIEICLLYTSDAADE